MRRLASRHEQDPLETERLRADSSAIARWATWIGSNVPPKTPSEPRDRSRRGVTPLPGLRLPLELHRPDPDRVAREIAGATQLGIDAQARQLSLEPLGRLLVVEVGLGREPLDPLAAHAERPVGVMLDVERVAHRLDAVDDDAGGLGRLRELVGGRQQRGERARNAADPLARGGRDRRPAHALSLRPRLAERRPSLGRGGHVHLVERHQHRLLEQRRVVRPSSSRITS